MSSPLPDIQSAFGKPATTGTKRNHPKTPLHTGRWECFSRDAASYEYPTTPIGDDILPPPTEILFTLEKVVDRVIAHHLDNLNRIFI